MRIAFFILFFMVSAVIYSQNSLCGLVVNSAQEPIAFATLSDLNGNGTCCDSIGKFELRHVQNKQAIIISAIGYANDTVIIDKKSFNGILQLKQNIININEVTVSQIQKIETKSAVSAFNTDKTEIKQLRARNVNEVLQNKAGFTNKSGYQAPLTLRGMSGKRLLVLRNNTRRFSSYPSGFMTHTINIYDLETIEVQKGAASVIYGAGAMAGIINLIDKSPFKKKGFDAKLTTGYGTVNKEKNLLLCGGYSNGKWAVKSVLRSRNSDNFLYPDGSVAENSFYSDRDIFITTGYKFSNKSSLVLTSDLHNEGPWGKPVGFNGSDYIRVTTDNELSNNYTLKYSYTPNGILKSLESNLFFSNESREFIKKYYTAANYSLSYSETTNFSDHYYGFNTVANFDLKPNQELLVGAEGYRFYISTPVDVIDYVNGFIFENRVSKNANSFNSGIFAEYRQNLSNKLKLIAGLRYNMAYINQGEVYSLDQEVPQEQNKEAFNGNIALQKRAGQHNLFKLNLARSFRMPETTELFVDSYTSNGIVYANPNLKPEYCNSIDAVYRYTNNHSELEISPFLWLMSMQITREEISGRPGTNYSYVNIGKSRLWGGELNYKATISEVFNASQLVFRCGLAYLNGTEIDSTASYLDEGTPLNYVPPFNIKSDISLNGTLGQANYHCALRGTYYDKQTRLGTSNFSTDAYLLFACNASLSFPKLVCKPSFSLAINNLFNTEYYNYLSYLPSEGRDFRIFITLNL